MDHLENFGNILNVPLSRIYTHFGSFLPSSLVLFTYSIIDADASEYTQIGIITN